jgi:hypothetical protein
MLFPYPLPGVKIFVNESDLSDGLISVSLADDLLQCSLQARDVSVRGDFGGAKKSSVTEAVFGWDGNAGVNVFGGKFGANLFGRFW